MRAGFRFKAWGLLARSAAVLAEILVLTACATGYAYVQPNAPHSGSYYTGDVPYTGQGYYDYYGTGPYYPGTSGWGYYDGTAPYAGSFGWFDGNFDDFGSPFFFNLGISDVWGFPGYWGPWYSIDFPVWSCWNGCWRHHHRHDHRRGHWNRHGHHGPRDAVAADPSTRPRLEPDRSPMTHMYRAPTRPLANVANRRPLDSASFAPRGADGMPLPGNLPDRPTHAVPRPPAFVEPPMPMRSATPHDFARPAAPAFAPARGTPPPARNSHSASVRIP